MPTDRRITDHTALTGANAATGDLFEVVDVSDTTDAATGTNKKITYANVAAGLVAAAGTLPSKLVSLGALTGDVADSSGNFADVTGLAAFTTVAGATYWFRVDALVQTNAAGVGILLTINHSTAVTSINYNQEYPTSATAWSIERVSALQGGTLPSTGPGTTSTRYTLVGNVVINTAGTLALQMKSETATETTVKAGTNMLLVRTA